MPDLERRIAGLSPEQLDRLLQRLKQQKEAPSRIGRVDREAGAFPLSFAQERLWFLDQIEPASPAYNVPYAIHLSGLLDRSALERSLAEVARRHEVLRTRFPAREGLPVAVIDPPAPPALPVFDLTGLAGAEREPRALTLALEEARRPFDLANGPVWRTSLVAFGPEEHVLLLGMHHIVCDGWSADVLFGELSALYGAFAQGRPSPLPNLPIQYVDYAAWQRERLQGPALEKELAYWRQRLAGAAAVLAMPADRRRPPAQTYNGASVPFVVPKATAEALRGLARAEGATLFMALLAAFQGLLARYSGQEDVVVGTPIAGRTRPEVEGLIGFFVNTLAMRADLSGEPSFRELVRRVREAALGAYDHQELPFEALVHELNPPRDAGRTPLFQAMFSLTGAARPPLELPGLGVTFLKAYPATAKFDLSLSLTEGGRGLTGRLVYNTDVYAGASMARVAAHYRALLEAAVADPERPLSALPLMTCEERRRLLVDWSDTAAPFPAGQGLQTLFEEQARRRGRAAAVTSRGQGLSYGELNARANQLAHHLIRCGAGPDVLVGTCLERSPEMIVAILGIIKAGAAYLPLDPGYPAERLAFMLQDACAPLVLTQESLRARLPTGARAIALDADWRTIAREPRTNPAPRATGESLAYAIYTSGSAGVPKGVAVPQRAVSRLVLNTDYIHLGPADVVAQASSASFDAATFEIWGALLCGARLAVITRNLALSPQEFARALRRQRVTTLFLTTSLFNLLAREAPGAFRSLRYLLFGGEAADPDAVRRVLRDGPPEHLLHVYGPTETTTFATWHEVTDVPPGALTVPIGRPIANTRAYVLDGRREPVPIGVPGELYLGGPGLARGYLNRPELTAERFVGDPFVPGERLYRTGDLVRQRPEGGIEFLGRLDRQVKVRGYRVEPGEVEAALAQHPLVRAAVVSVREDGPGERRLVAYAVPRGEGLEASELRAFLRARLPDYMVPAAFVLLGALPLTPGGKVDRAALPAPDPARREQAWGYVAPRDPLELELAGIWGQLLGVEQVGVHDSFFDLGGHSLLAVRLMAAIEAATGQRVPLATLFAGPTVEHLARALRGEAPVSSWTALVPIQTGGTRPPLFCVHGGGGTVFIYRELAALLGPEQPVYGLQEVGRDGGQAAHNRVEEMAAHYLAEVRALRPQGPYCLAGYSFGNTVAFEMAQQLRAAGEEVALLALIDTRSPGQRPSLRPRRATARPAGNLAERLRAHRRNLRRLAPGDQAMYLGAHSAAIGAAVGALRGAKRAAWWAVYHAFLAARRPFPVAWRNLDHYAFYAQAIAAYRPRPYPGHITLFRSAQLAAEEADPFLGWDRLAQGGVEVHDIPGRHEALFEGPGLEPLADGLRACLARVEG